MPRNRNNEQGNVFLIILIAVVLFGALIFTFSRSGSQGTSTISKQEAKILAQEILNYARLVEGAVDRVRRNGCSENEISFQNSTLTGYTNTDAPGDNSCHIFNENGGKISLSQIPLNSLDKSFTGQPNYGDPIFIGNFNIVSVGTTNLDLLYLIPFVSNEVCQEINNLIQLGTSSIPVDNFGGGTNFFTGSFSTATTPLIGDEALQIQNNTSFCVNNNISNIFIHTLLSR